MKFRVVSYAKEKDGIKMPHIHKQIVCDPPASPDFIISHTDMVWETIGGVDQRVMTQFLEDAGKFEDKFQPIKVWKFDNEVELNPETQRNDYYVKIWYEDKAGERVLYNFRLNHGDEAGTFALEKTSFDLDRLSDSSK